MLSAKQNFLETIQLDGKPDRLVAQFEGTTFLPVSAVSFYERGARRPGMPPTPDRFGTTILWPEGQFAAMPHVTEENKAIPDITEWKKSVVFPDLLEVCGDPAMWESYVEQVAKIDRSNTLVMAFMPTGVFERLHFLMGMEDALVNFLMEPEAMKELCDAVGEYRYQYAKLIVDYMKPDIMLTHDDWGAKKSMFISPDTWREFIKPTYVKQNQYMKEHGVIVMHHADSFMEPIVEDMVELGVDIWQGTLPENDIVKLQKQLAGRMTLMGGIDASIVDRADSTEEEIRREVRRACETYAPGGHYMPCITYGGPGCLFKHVDPIINDEIKKFNHEVYGV
ncbi:MAG: uroporphyrinogen decarboxylase family protein [Oscillospiraceae bacterium]|nr:uroporphyrinogen decarboxylase family protein [Oscillospiraceae bacterium]